MIDVNTLYKWVNKNSERGDCTCGKCIDAPEELNQPKGHTANVTFFKVALKGEPNKEEFATLVKEILPNDGTEIGYMQLGGILGDQGFALQVMGIGYIFELWRLLSPDTMIPFMDEETKLKMAGHGMVSIQAKTEEE